MAYVLAWYKSVFTFADKGGNETTREHRLRESDDAGDISALITAQNDLLADYVAISDAVIKSVNLSRVTINDAFALPSVGEVENNAHLLYTITAHPNKSAFFDVPAPKDGAFVGAPGTKQYNVVDMADALVTNFADNFAGTTPNYLVSDGETIVAGSGVGKRIHKKSNKG